MNLSNNFDEVKLIYPLKLHELQSYSIQSGFVSQFVPALKLDSSLKIYLVIDVKHTGDTDVLIKLTGIKLPL